MKGGGSNSAPFFALFGAYGQTQGGLLWFEETFSLAASYYHVFRFGKFTGAAVLPIAAVAEITRNQGIRPYV